jgi:glycerol uptake facilitator-like aquaporin
VFVRVAVAVGVLVAVLVGVGVTVGVDGIHLPPSTSLLLVLTRMVMWSS